MNSNHQSIDFLYSLLNRGIKPWANGDAIKVFIPEETKLTEDEKSYIKNNKPELLNFLLENELHTKEIKKKILKTNLKNTQLSFSQQRLWFIEKYESGSNIYNIPRVYKLLNREDLPLLITSIRNIVERHEVLRTFIKTNPNGNAYQEVDNTISSFKVNTHKSNTKEELEARIKEEINHVFNLELEHPIRVCSYELANKLSYKKDIYLSIVIHHIASDGWSMDIFLNELKLFYEHHKDKNTALGAYPAKLKKIQIQYKDFALWQKNYLSGKVLDQKLDYWRSQLIDYELLSLPTDKPRPENLDYHGDDIFFELEEKTSNQLRFLSRKLNISLYALLLGTFYLLLKSLSNQNDLIVGSVIANRHHEDIENLIGFFVNTIALRKRIDIHENISAYMKQIASDVLNAQMHQDLPFEKLIEELNIPKDPTRHPIFQTMFVVQSFSTKVENLFGDVIEVYEHEENYNVAKFDLTTTWDDSETCLKCKFNYRTSLFNKNTIEKYIDRYKEILHKLSGLNEESTAHVNISQLIQTSHLTFKEPEELTKYPREKTLFQLFEEQATLTPKNLAVVDSYQDNEYSYEKLHSDILKISHFLLKKPCHSSSKQLIGILSEKGYNHVVASLSIMKAGKAYLPLHHEWPIERIEEILTQGGVNILLASKNQTLRKDFQTLAHKYQIFIIEDLLKKLTEEKNLYFPRVDSSEVAYVIFTSGSTGKPKGVTISHQGAVNTIHAINQKFNIKSKDRVLALSELSFDLSVYDIFGTLAVGGAIIFPDSEKTKDPSHWITLIEQYRITLWNTVPQLAGLLINEAQLNNKKIDALRLFLLSGDWIPLKLPEKIKASVTKAKVVSLGGATEGSIWSIWYEIKDVEKNWTSIPYGAALPNQRMLILDDSLNRCPIGVTGEIFIGGTGVALNYWGDQERTTKSFFEHPSLGRIYKTGDLGKWHSEGYIEFIGRKDTQIKINGHRVELDEISSHLSRIEGIEDAVVTFNQEGKSSFIAAYYSGIKQEEAHLINRLARQLPEYMIPKAIIYMNSIPLTANGKVDRKALPEPQYANTQQLVLPRNELEKKLYKIFEEILDLKAGTLSITDDFFALGGDSILSIQVVSQIRQKLDINISIKDIFYHKTIERLYDNVLKNQKPLTKNSIKTEQGCLNGEIELLPIQEWFFTQPLKNPHYWNQSFLIKTPSLNIAVLKKSLSILEAHHDALRIRYRLASSANNSAPYEQYYAQESFVELKVLDFSTIKTEEELQSKLTDWQKNFHLIDGPLYSVGYIHDYPDGSARIHLAFHHLIVDTVSWRILTNDLKTIYTKLLVKPNLLPSNILETKGSSYRQWSKAIQQYRNLHREEGKYWSSVLADHAIHKDNINHHIEYPYFLSHKKLYLSKEKTQQLTQKINLAYNTQINDVLLTSLSYALQEFTEKDVHYITLEGHGREEIDSEADITRTVGWFTSMYPVRLETHKNSNIGTNIKIIKENLRAIPQKGVGYGAIVGYKNVELPKICFNYLGQFDSSNQESNWNIIDEASGQSRSTENQEYNDLSINAAIINGQLQISASSKFNQFNLEKFISFFKDHLEKIVEHLLGRSEQEYTISDFERYESYTEIKKTLIDNQKLFMLPPGVGGYECYLNNIEPELQSNLVLFNNFNHYLNTELGDKFPKNTSFENLAETYIAQIKTIQPSGPYSFFGWSFGAVLALEISKQFIQAGHTVSHLFMVDPLFKVKETIETLGLSNDDIPLVGQLNHKYSPDFMALGENIKIFLFKAMKNDEATGKIFKHYALETKFNYLDKVIDQNKINLVEINSNHFSWVQDKTSIKLISKTISDTLKND